MVSPEINPRVLAAAVKRLEHSTGIPCAAHEWRIVRFERPHSVIHRLTDKTSDVVLYYKAYLPRRHEHGDSVDSLRNRLARAVSLTDGLIQETDGTRISPAPVLATDSSNLTIVTLGVCGREIGRDFHFALPGKSSKILDHARLIGKACAAIERFTGKRPAPFDSNGFMSQIENRLRNSEIRKSQTTWLRREIHDLLIDRLASDSSVYVHGDLSLSNILVARKGIALIDFGWVSRFRGFDVGLLCYRLLGMDKLRPRWGRRIRSTVMAEYEEQVGSSLDLTSLQLVNLILLVRGLRSTSKNRIVSRLALDRMITDVRAHGITAPCSRDGEFRWWWAFDACA